MHYIFLSACFGALFASGYKMTTIFRARRTAVNVCMLLVAGGVSGLVCIARHEFPASRAVLVLGGAGGVCLYMATASFFQVMRFGRLAIQWTVICMAVAIPAVASIIFWGERPTAVIVLGFGLAALAVVFMGIDKGKTAHTDDTGQRYNPLLGTGARLRWGLLIALAFVGTGLTQVCNKAVVQYVGPESMFPYLFLLHSVAGLLAVVQTARSRVRPSRVDVGLGVFMGGMSVAVTWSLLLGLSEVPAIVFYPLRSIHTILLTMAISLVVWKEKIRRPGLMGLAFAIAAIWCLQTS